MNDSHVPLLVSSTTVHDLPYEIIESIFGHLGVRDVWRCMMVSKQWYSIGSKTKINELIFKSTDKYYAFHKEWCTRELFDQSTAISNLHLFKPLPMNTAFLKRLALYHNDSRDFQLVHLNKFVHLQHLELNYFDTRFQQEITFLNLPNLKILSCHAIHCKLVFNTPALTEVYMTASKIAKFENLPTLKLLEYSSIYVDSDAKLLLRIKNVKVFRMKCYNNVQMIRAALHHFNELEEIRWEYNRGAGYIDREYFQRCLDKISEERRNPNKRNVKIYLFGKLWTIMDSGRSTDDRDCT